MEVVEGVLPRPSILFYVLPSHSLTPEGFNGLLYSIAAHLLRTEKKRKEREKSAGRNERIKLQKVGYMMILSEKEGFLQGCRHGRAIFCALALGEPASVHPTGDFLRQE